MTEGQDKLGKNIEERLMEKGASLVGFADLKKIPDLPGENMVSGISIAVTLDPSIIKGIKDSPTGEYYREYLKANSKLADLAETAAGMLRKNGYRTYIQEPSGDISLYKDLCSPLPHKTIATRAGLGWIGKTALLITREFGSAVRIVSVITDREFRYYAKPVSRSECGECIICVDKCPGGAANGKDWHTGIYRNDFFNAHTCHKTARKRSEAAGIDSTICGRCIAVCPWTKKYIKRYLDRDY